MELLTHMLRKEQKGSQRDERVNNWPVPALFQTWSNSLSRE